jgi:hypothetical protein
MATSSPYTYQLNAYFGIFYPIDLAPLILSIAATDSKYAALDTDDPTVIVDGYTIFGSTNSDEPAPASSIGFIAVDEMTVGGPDMDTAEQSFLQMDPASMVAAEQKHAVAVGLITDLYESIIRALRTHEPSVRSKRSKVYSGWQALVGTWENTDDDASDDADDSPSEST